MVKGHDVLNPAARKAISNIRQHIAKDCLSNIPPHVSTCGNERLHRHLNNIMKTSKIGLDTAFVRCSRLFFKINNKIDGDQGSLASLLSSARPIFRENLPYANRNKHFGFTSFEQNQCLSLGNVNEQHLDHAYVQEVQENKNILTLSIAYSALSFYEIYKPT